jgi:non-heme chloroperoxidase
VAESGKLTTHTWKELMAAFLRDDAERKLGDIDTPTILIWGPGDEVFSATDQQALERSIRNAVLVTYPDCGHAPHWERPARFVADLAAFVLAVS